MSEVNKELLRSHTHSIGGLTIHQFHDFPSVETDWRGLETHGLATIYQSFDWCKTWMNVWGNSLLVRPYILVAKNENNEIVFILPWQLRRRLGVTCLEWLGQPSFNYGAGLFSKKIVGAEWFDLYASELLNFHKSPAVINLRNMPERLFELTNPLSILHKSRGANSSFALNLNSNFEALQSSKRTPKSLSKIKRRDVRLRELGDLVFEYIVDPATARLAINESIDHKNRQLRENGVANIFSTEDRQFYTDVFANNLAVFKLTLDGETLSTMIGAKFNGCFHLMIASLGSQKAQNLSPGDYLLRKTIAYYCGVNIHTYDFGSGEQAYKLHWADSEIQLFNFIAARSLRGLLLASAWRFSESLKRYIKSHDRIWKIVVRLRERLLGQPS